MGCKTIVSSFVVLVRFGRSLGRDERRSSVGKRTKLHCSVCSLCSLCSLHVPISIDPAHPLILSLTPSLTVSLSESPPPCRCNDRSISPLAHEARYITARRTAVSDSTEPNRTSCVHVLLSSRIDRILTIVSTFECKNSDHKADCAHRQHRLLLQAKTQG